MKRTKKEKKRIFVISTSIITLSVIMISSVSKEWLKILDNKHKIKELSTKYDELLSNEEKLKSEVTKLHDPNYVARYAKEKYFYSSDGEIIIRLD